MNRIRPTGCTSVHRARCVRASSRIGALAAAAVVLVGTALANQTWRIARGEIFGPPGAVKESVSRQKSGVFDQGVTWVENGRVLLIVPFPKEGGPSKAEVPFAPWLPVALSPWPRPTKEDVAIWKGLEFTLVHQTEDRKRCWLNRVPGKVVVRWRPDEQHRSATEHECAEIPDLLRPIWGDVVGEQVREYLATGRVESPSRK